MTDELKLIRDTERASRAAQYLNDELLTEAFTTLEQAYIERWRGSELVDDKGREKLFIAINIIGKVKDHLTSLISDGKIAAIQLDQLAELAQRQKRFA